MKLLLDYPWEIREAWGYDPVPKKVIQDFMELLSSTGLKPVRFIEPSERAALHETVTQRGRGGNVYQALYRFLNHCCRDIESAGRAAPLATPNPEPKGRRNSWKSSLRDEMGDLLDWRNPQIIVPRGRRSDWQVGDDIELHCDQCSGEPVIRWRVLAVLEDYATHRFTMSDRDPWDVRCVAPSARHPCYLPNPLIPDGDPLQNNLSRIPIAQLCEELDKVRGEGWHPPGGKYLFLPPTDWRPEDIHQEAWRKGHAFPRSYAKARDQVGYLDSGGRIWLWHSGEDHWDIQLGGTNYIRVNHAGDEL